MRLSITPILVAVSPELTDSEYDCKRQETHMRERIHAVRLGMRCQRNHAAVSDKHSLVQAKKRFRQLILFKKTTHYVPSGFGQFFSSEPSRQSLTPLQIFAGLIQMPSEHRCIPSGHSSGKNAPETAPETVEVEWKQYKTFDRDVKPRMRDMACTADDHAQVHQVDCHTTVIPRALLLPITHSVM